MSDPCSPVPLRQPTGVLGRIVSRTVADLAALQLPAGAQRSTLPPGAFCAALRAEAQREPLGLGLIAEVKPASPSRGRLLSRAAVPAYVAAVAVPAAALSVLVDTPHFNGGFDLLAQVRSLTNRPLLAKGFFVSSRQLTLAHEAGADAVLLMASVLSPAGLHALAEEAQGLGLDLLLEAHDADEIVILQDATIHLQCDSSDVCIGVNARDLTTLAIDEGRAHALLATMPHGRRAPLRVAESGIASRQALDGLRGIADAVLVGSHLATASDPAEAARALGFSEAGWP